MENIKNTITVFVGVLAIGGIMQFAFPGHVKAGGGGGGGSTYTEVVSDAHDDDNDGVIEEIVVTGHKPDSQPHVWGGQLSWSTTSDVYVSCQNCYDPNGEPGNIEVNVEILADEIYEESEQEGEATVTIQAPAPGPQIFVYEYGYSFHGQRILIRAEALN